MGEVLKGIVRCFAVLVCLAVFAICPPSMAIAADTGGEITVSAAASLTNAFTEIKEAFEKAQPKVLVRTNFAASNPLLQQMEQGAPVDVFASADEETMDKAVAKKLIDPVTRRNFARNDLVMIVPADSSLALQSASGLSGDAVRRIAVGNPDSVPAGRYAKDALTTLGLWEDLRPKYVFGASVRQVLDYVTRGEVDAAFVYRTDALQAGKSVRVVTVLEGHKPILYPLAVATGGGNARDAAAFTAFVLSPEGQAVLAKYGFSKGD